MLHCTLIVDYRKLQGGVHTPIHITSSVMERVSNFKFLGVHITLRLSLGLPVREAQFSVEAQVVWTGSLTSLPTSTTVPWRASWLVASLYGMVVAPPTNVRLSRKQWEQQNSSQATDSQLYRTSAGYSAWRKLTKSAFFSRLLAE